jgi:formate hydrogenlyase subunit 6/NADH:ubiquinone oxidoreductase subunit I
MGKKSRGLMFKKTISQMLAKPATCQYPFVKTELPEDFRGLQVFDPDLCIGCGLCSRDCPTKAIEMVEVDGKKLPLFKLDRCIFCYQCAESCRRNAIKSSAFYELATTDKSTLVLKPKASACEGEKKDDS